MIFTHLSKILFSGDNKKLNKNSIIDLIENSLINKKRQSAIKEEEHTYTYEELNELIRCAERNIIKNSLEEKKIIICLDKSAQFIALVIAIWKNGGTYIPIDTEMPEERINYIIENSRADAIVLNNMNKNYKIRQIEILSMFEENGNDTEVKHKKNEIKGSSLAYIIYTSGSTGKPKGVKVTHDNLLYFMQSMKEYIKIKNDDRWLSITTVCFDISIFEMFFPLICGACLIIGKKRLLIDMQLLKKTLKDEKITIMQATPVTWKLLINSDIKILKNLKVLCGGEKLDNSLAETLYKNAKEVWNLYGPTETTIWSSVNKLKNAKDTSIGRPIKGTTFYMYNDDMKLNNKEGELYIGGPGVSSGYINNEKLSQKSFIRNPNNEKEIIYKTGDYVKFENGKYYCLGRIDFQIKINGHRIECEDIEKNIESICGVEKAIVIPYDKKIYSFVKRNTETINEMNIKDQLRKKINGYMIPYRIFFIENIPMTLNKKIDRKILINDFLLKKTALNSKKSKKVKNDLENKIKNIWQKAIGEDIDIEKSYKEYPADSLTLTIISIEMEEIWKDFSIEEIFKYESIKKIIEHRNKKNNEKELVLKKAKKYCLDENNLKLVRVNDMEAMMANSYFLNREIMNFQDCYIFNINNKNIKNNNIENEFKDIFDNIIELKCKYIFGSKYKIQSIEFKNLIKYEKIYIKDDKMLKNVVNKNIYKALNINNISLKLTVLYYQEYTIFIFKYPNAKMDEISFFSYVNKFFKNILYINVDSNQHTLKVINDTNNFEIELDEKCFKNKAIIYNTRINNVIEYYIAKALANQHKLKKIDYIINAKSHFGNTLAIGECDYKYNMSLEEYINIKEVLKNKTDNDVLISYNDISKKIIKNIKFEHIEYNGYNINIEIYNMENKILLDISKKEEEGLDFKKLKRDLTNMIEGEK